MNLLLRFGAVSGVLSGLLLAVPGGVEAATGETLTTSILIGISPALAAPLLTALYLAQSGRGRRSGGLGYVVNTVGLAFFGAAAFALNIVVFPLDPELVLAQPTRIVILSGAAIYIIGTVWFAIGMLRARVHPRIPVVLYLIAMPLFPVAAQLPDSPLTAGLHVVAGAALVWLGIAVRNRMLSDQLAATTLAERQVPMGLSTRP